jgi:dolichol kinase
MLTKQELGRQIMHILIGLSMVTLFYYDLMSPFAVFLGIIIGVLSSLISKRVDLPGFSFFIKHIEREEQRKKFPGKGLIFFFIGFLLVMQLFPKDIALAALMVLTFGDSISHLFGAKFGQVKNIFNGNGQKLLEGTFAGIIAGGIGASFFVSVPEAFLASTIAMIAEVVKIEFNEHTLDDNLIVPLIAGTVMLLVRLYL